MEPILTFITDFYY